MSKAEKRAAIKAAAERAAAARRRRQAVLGALAGLAVVVVLIGVFVAVGRGGDDDKAEPGTASSAGATAGAPEQPADKGFPPLPAGADPALGTKPTVAKGTGTLTKLTATPLIKGTGPAAQAGQQITVNYVGAFYATGEEFDASWKRSQPFTFQLGGGQVIPGWDQGLVGANVGSRVQLDIPAELGYGEKPAGGRPGGPLRFVVDVLAVQ
ncbi:peptidylprolyl isomerase [Micromonospora echinofusca]|uniref:Peptidyl-prolyl cis-trans isomerase n=1 Tax=Micromonospora echinofusca TaxID=47858 RepID=A0ABS3VSU4_MICEH|nr:FKBP-type peptidyl-prolyl cis-trans isomerase [Micromonospora echinofusca]MBO4207622.1 peptidylprolyl isomerase [Micromonospora echinofusca]